MHCIHSEAEHKLGTKPGLHRGATLSIPPKARGSDGLREAQTALRPHPASKMALMPSSNLDFSLVAMGIWGDREGDRGRDTVRPGCWQK